MRLSGIPLGSYEDSLCSCFDRKLFGLCQRRCKLFEIHRQRRLSFSYDGCILEMEKSNGPDFYLYSIKRKADSGRPLLAMYQGGAPDVRDFYDDKEKIIERKIEKVKIETRERRGVDGDSYEALIAPPVNSIGRFEYFHVISEKLTAEDMDLVKKIIFSIQAK